MIRSLLLAVLILLTPAATATAQPAPRTAAEADVFLQRLLNDIAAYSTPHQTLVIEAEDLVLFAITGAESAVRLAERRASRREVAAWADAWEAEAASKVAAIRAKTEDLPPFPEAAFQRLIDLEPAFRSQVPGYRKVGIETRRLIDLCASYTDTVAETVRKAAVGDADALDQMVIRIVHGTRLVIEAENAMLEVSIAATGENHPQTHLARASLHGNLAILALYDLTLAALSGEDVDRATAVATMRAEAEKALVAARDIERDAAVLDRRMAAGPQTETIKRIRTAMSTFRESSAVEVAIANLLRAAADNLEGGKAPAAVLEEDIAGLDALATRRIEIQARRMQILAP
jgi:hypothetical protein